MTTKARRRVRKKVSRTRRVIHKVTLKRARTRWKRRARKIRRAYRAMRSAPTKLRLTRCSCGRSVPASSMQTHLAAHAVRDKAAQKQAAAKRAAAAKRHTKQAAQQPQRRYPNQVRNRATNTARPSRAEAARAASGWIALGSGAMLASPLFLSAGPTWLGLLGAGACAAGGAAYAVERQWGHGNGGGRMTRWAANRAARQAGCSGACMHSTKPKNTCNCSCGGRSHGSLAGSTP
jgi:hypothetical protein